MGILAVKSNKPAHLPCCSEGTGGSGPPAIALGAASGASPIFRTGGKRAQQFTREMRPRRPLKVAREGRYQHQPLGRLSASVYQSLVKMTTLASKMRSACSE